MIHGLKMIIPLHSLFLHHQMASHSASSCLNCSECSDRSAKFQSYFFQICFSYCSQIWSGLPFKQSTLWTWLSGPWCFVLLLLCLVSCVPAILRHLQGSELDADILASGPSQWTRGKETACIAIDMGSVSGLGRSPGGCPGGGHGYPCSILAWRIPWTEEPGGLPSMGSQSRTRLKWLRTQALLPPDLCTFCALCPDW